jgi:hypothetical protein
MVFGCICGFFSGPLIRADESIDARVYSRILQGAEMATFIETFRDHIGLQLVNPGFLDRGEVTFVQDNAPPHRARMTQEVLSGLGLKAVRLPPQSPDINVIENVWGFLTTGALRDRHNRTGDEAYRTILEAWEKLDESYLESLVLNPEEAQGDHRQEW